VGGAFTFGVAKVVASLIGDAAPRVEAEVPAEIVAQPES
jgi:hypothetical protein